jgi:hypothetical protein
MPKRFKEKNPNNKFNRLRIKNITYSKSLIKLASKATRPHASPNPSAPSLIANARRSCHIMHAHHQFVCTNKSMKFNLFRTNSRYLPCHAYLSARLILNTRFSCVPNVRGSCHNMHTCAHMTDLYACNVGSFNESIYLKLPK